MADSLSCPICSTGSTIVAVHGQRTTDPAAMACPDISAWTGGACWYVVSSDRVTRNNSIEKIRFNLTRCGELLVHMTLHYGTQKE
jgi:ribosomal protein S27AE